MVILYGPEMLWGNFQYIARVGEKFQYCPNIQLPIINFRLIDMDRYFTRFMFLIFNEETFVINVNNRFRYFFRTEKYCLLGELCGHPVLRSFLFDQLWRIWKLNVARRLINICIFFIIIYIEQEKYRRIKGFEGGIYVSALYPQY